MLFGWALALVILTSYWDPPPMGKDLMGLCLAPLLITWFLGGVPAAYITKFFAERILPQLARQPDLGWLNVIPKLATVRYLEFMTRAGTITNIIDNPSITLTFAEWPEISVETVRALAFGLPIRTLVETDGSKVTFRLNLNERASYHDFHNWLKSIIDCVITPMKEHGFMLHDASFHGEPRTGARIKAPPERTA